MLGKLRGKKTIIGGLVLSLLSAVGLLDALINGSPQWLSVEQYVAIGGFIGGLTEAALRVGVKSEVEKAINSK